MESIFKSERVVPESCLRYAFNGLTQKCVGVPTNLKIAGCGKLEEAHKVVFPFLLQAHHMIESIFDLQHAVLGNVRRIGNRGPVRIGDNAVFWSAGALRVSQFGQKGTKRECDERDTN